MNIGINALILKEQNTGTGYYTKSLIEEIVKCKEHNFFIFVKDENLLNLKSDNIKIIEVPFANKGTIQRILSEQFLLKKYVKKYDLDILHSTSFIIPLNIKNIPNIVTVHDMFHELFKDTIKPLVRIYHTLFFNLCIKKSDFIIADSENTRQDIHKLLNINTDKIKTVHLGLNPLFSNNQKNNKITMNFKNLNLGYGYVLYVGSLEPRKNITGVIESFNKIKDKIKENLVIVGASKWKESELSSLIQKYELNNRVIFTGYVDEQLLPLIYKNAKVFFFPSFYEGFGFPVIEAMSQGVPVITSNNSSLKEIAEGASILVDPNDIEGMSEKLFKLLNDNEQLQNLAQSGSNRAKKFTWEYTAKQTIEAYEIAIKNRR